MTTKRENAGVHAAHKITIRTTRRTELKNATAEIESLVRDSGIKTGVCHLYVPHTTAGVLVNEGYDPDVARDMEVALDRLFPQQNALRPRGRELGLAYQTRARRLLRDRLDRRWPPCAGPMAANFLR